MNNLINTYELVYIQAQINALVLEINKKDYISADYIEEKAKKILDEIESRDFSKLEPSEDYFSQGIE